jgi:hypothetical protein
VTGQVVFLLKKIFFFFFAIYFELFMVLIRKPQRWQEH